MTDILDEVLKDYIEEKKIHYFKRFLPFVIIITICVIILMLVYNMYQEKHIQANRLASETLLKSIKTLSYDNDLAMNSLINIANNVDTKVAELASLESIAVYISSEEYDKAKFLLDKIINSNYTNLTKNYARLLWLSLVIDQKIISDDEKQLAELHFKEFNNETQIFYGTVSIIRTIYYIKNGSTDLAMNLLKKIVAINDMNEIIKNQANAMLVNLENN